MAHRERVKIEGRITDVFAHRFVIERSNGRKLLADLGPKGVGAFPVEPGLRIVAEGEMKPSELKVERIARKGEAAIAIEHGKKDHRHDDADPDAAKQAVREAGFEPIGVPRRKPRHFEVLARKDRRLVECHVEFDGRIRKERQVDADDDKWSADLRHAA